MSAEEKAENICRSIGIVMPAQKEDVDMQREKCVGPRKEAEKTKPVRGTAKKPAKKTEGYTKKEGTEAPIKKRDRREWTIDAGVTELPGEVRKRNNGRKKRKKKDPYMHRLKRRCALLAALALVLGGMVVVRPYLKRYTVPVGGRTITGNSSYITDESELPVQNPLILVNKANPLPDDYEVDLHWLSNGTCAVSSMIYEPLSEMLTDGSSEGLQFVVASGYRDVETQQQLLDEDIAADMQNEGMSWQEAYDKETMETMPPGYSEHSTGLAVDLVALDYQMLDAGQEETPENQWLQENCSRYGFILRYPEGKEAVTDIHYESWHFRYVGVKAAQEIMSRGSTLEEYLGAY